MPGVIGTQLPIQDNTHMVKDNIEITGVDDPVDHDYNEEPKIDIDIDPPILPENPKESIDGTAPETTIKYNTEPTEQIDGTALKTTIEQSNKTARQLKEPTRKSSRTQTKVKRMIPSMKGKSYEYAATQVNESTFEYDPRLIKTIFTQLLQKFAIKTWGKDATNAAKAKMNQLYWQNSFMPKLYNNLSPEQREKILESHIFIKQKKSGEIKGRTAAGGNKQQGYINQEDASSPTVLTKSMILTSMINAIKERDIAIIDIPNTFIQTEVMNKNKRVIVCICGMLVDILVKVAPDIYKDYVKINSKEEKQILV